MPPLNGIDYCQNCGKEVDDNTIDNNTGIILKWKKTGFLDNVIDTQLELACQILEITARKIINREIGSVNNGVTNGMILCESIKHLDSGMATIKMENWIKNGCKKYTG